MNNGQRNFVRTPAVQEQGEVLASFGEYTEADRARVVKRFVRLENSRSEPGAGLGLSLVQAVAAFRTGADASGGAQRLGWTG